MSRRRVRDLRDTASAMIALARVTLRFRAGGNRAAVAVVREATTIAPSTQEQVEASGVDVWRTALAVWRARRFWPLRARCLETSVAMQRLFAARGLDAAVRIGVRKADDDFGAHAWCEVGDFVLDADRVATGFAALPIETVKESPR